MKLKHLKAIYIMLWGFIFFILMMECGLQIHRRLINNEVKNMRTNGIFARELIEEGSLSSLWEIPYEKYKPFQIYEFEKDGLKYEIKINGSGYRCDDFKIDKPNNLIRIICIGGSTTIQGRLNSLTYPAILEKQLKMTFPNKNIEVLNLGISGTTSKHWLNYQEKLFSLNPDMVIQYNGVNDIVRFSNFIAKKHTIIKFFNKFYLFHFIFNNSKLFVPYYNLTLNNFKKINMECKKRNILYYAGSFSYPLYNIADKPFQRKLNYEIENGHKQLNLKYYTEYEKIISNYNESFIQFVKQNSISYVRIDNKFNMKDLFTDSCHMTEKGINLLAHTFYTEIFKDKTIFKNYN